MVRTPTLAKRLLVVLVAVALAASGCGLTAEDQAEVIEEVQYELLGTTTSTTSTTVANFPTFPVVLFWHTAGDNRLKPINRLLSEPPSAAQTLNELVAGPTPEEQEANPDVQNQLDPTMEPRLSQIDGDVYQIQIQRSIDEQLTSEQAAEFVCTATQFPEINAVTIVNQDDEPFNLSGAGAVPIPGPARISDFNDCVEEQLPVDPEPAEGEDDGSGESTTTSP